MKIDDEIIINVKTNDVMMWNPTMQWCEKPIMTMRKNVREQRSSKIQSKKNAHKLRMSMSDYDDRNQNQKQ